MTEKVDVRYVLLCRHGAQHDGHLTTVAINGRNDYPIHAVGERLCEELQRADPPGRDQIVLRAIGCASSPEAEETLRRLLERLPVTLDWPAKVAVATDDQRQIPILQPSWMTTSVDQTADETDTVADRLLSMEGPDGNAVLVVGHQPMMSRVADSLLNSGRRALIRRAPTPLDRSGIVCIAVAGGDRHKRAWITWAISYDDTAAGQAVRDKIARKMDIAKSFGGLLAFALTIVLGVLLDGQNAQSLGRERMSAIQLSAVCYLFATALYIMTMYSYDTLLMPIRFWGETRPGSRSHQAGRRWLVERPPSSDAWVLYQNMMRIWRNLFTTASILAFIATALFAFAALHIAGWLAILSLPTGAFIGWWIYRSRPVLGSED